MPRKPIQTAKKKLPRRSKTAMSMKPAFQSWLAIALVSTFVIVGSAFVSMGKAAAKPPTPCNGVNMCAPVPNTVPELIVYWSQYYHLDPDRMTRIAECESHFDPNAGRGKSHFGVYQFLSTTYAANHAAAGAGPDLWNPSDNIRTAAYMQSIGQQWQWECKG